MTDTIETLYQRMDAAARALDFEEARRLRDRINLVRGGATADEAERADAAGLTRQQPGAMGLGTSQQRMVPPPGWRPPAKPDPMTAGRSRRAGRNSEQEGGS
ncbi:MAG: excinuclease ABC subunit B [Sphingomonadales bacterium]|nr:MAG: excinuclease ABC subunit B [Sphingomonadales bacterium]